MSQDLRPPLSKRISSRQWSAVDAVVAVVGCAALVVFAATDHHHYGVQGVPLAVTCVLAAGAALPVAVRRRRPLTVLAVVLVFSVAYGIVQGVTSSATAATLVLYTAATQLPRRLSVACLLAVEAGVVVSFAATNAKNTTVLNAAFTALVQFTVWLLADSIRRRREFAESVRQQGVHRAVVDERLRIAREMHDIVAHAMSVVVVQAGVGRRVLAERPDEAERSLGSIETTARHALAEMRHLLGVLRRDDQAPASRSPAPGVHDLEALADEVSASGLPVSVVVDGSGDHLAASVQLTVYRVVQEALTNVIKHADHPTAVTVRLHYGVDGAEVEVTDDGRPVGPTTAAGHGLTGMGERVAIHGGTFAAAARPGGGFRVLVTVPGPAAPGTGPDVASAPLARPAP